ncbi:unnamed protein product [Allacma fusca]|uniref:Uncharacterized protein n=1 Tax=Allacma fusca TaxID=39272 RepID=A0A8J2NXZ0_9HEXA|nr:unnamed protein product [Allacma fusca]
MLAPRILLLSLYYIISFLKCSTDAFCISELVSVGLLNHADIVIDTSGASSQASAQAQWFLHCTSDNYVQYIIPNLTEVLTSIPSGGYGRVIYFTRVTHFLDVTDTLEEIHPKNWVTVILLSEKLTPAKFEELENAVQNQTQIIARNLSILSLVLILEEFDSPIQDGALNVTAVDIYAVKGAIFLEYCQIHLPLNNFELTKIYRRRHFHKMPLKAVAVPQDVANPHQITYAVDEYNKTTIQPSGGYEAVVALYLSRALNFTVEANYGTGFLGNPGDGPPRGMAQQIRNDEADISITSSEIFAERQQYLTFLIPTYESRLYAFVLKQSNNALRNIFLKPFDNNIWAALLLMWALLGLSLLFLTWVRRYWSDETHENDEDIAKEAFLWSMGTLCQQGNLDCSVNKCSL